MEPAASVCVALGPDGAERSRNWAFLRARYARLYPDWEIVESDKLGHPWSKGTALRDAVERSSGDVVILADADIMVGPDVLPTCLRMLKASHGWIVPHRKVYRLTEAKTQDVIATNEDFPRPVAPQGVVRRPHLGARGGGLVVVTRSAWDEVGGIDPRFRGWGGEDISFGRCLHTLVGACRRLVSPAWHLWHPNQAITAARRGSPANEALAGRYLDAYKDQEAMRALVEEHLATSQPDEPAVQADRSRRSRRRPVLR